MKGGKWNEKMGEAFAFHYHKDFRINTNKVCLYINILLCTFVFSEAPHVLSAFEMMPYSNHVIR